MASIVVDGRIDDWMGIPGLATVLHPIGGVTDVDDSPATVHVAHDGEQVYVLVTVGDDYDFVDGDLHLTGALALQFAIDAAAGMAMGAEEEDDEVSLGMVDIWHWELECPVGAESGGAVSGAGEGSPGNDDACNFDDEYATVPDERDDDDQGGAENSLLGVFDHSDPVNGSDGTWFFEMSRPLQTADATDAQFVPGGSALLVLAYWDADQGPDGWEDDGHVVSADLGWIEVVFG